MTSIRQVANGLINFGRMIEERCPRLPGSRLLGQNALSEDVPNKDESSRSVAHLATRRPYECHDGDRCLHRVCVIRCQAFGRPSGPNRSFYLRIHEFDALGGSPSSTRTGLSRNWNPKPMACFLRCHMWPTIHHAAVCPSTRGGSSGDVGNHQVHSSLRKRLRSSPTKRRNSDFALDRGFGSNGGRRRSLVARRSWPLARRFVGVVACADPEWVGRGGHDSPATHEARRVLARPISDCSSGAIVVPTSANAVSRDSDFGGSDCQTQRHSLSPNYAPIASRNASASSSVQRVTSSACSASTITRASGSVPE